MGDLIFFGFWFVIGCGVYCILLGIMWLVGELINTNYKPVSAPMRNKKSHK